MNGLFITQGLGLRFFDRLSRALVGPLRLDRCGFYVCDSLFYQRYLDEMPDFPDRATGIVKEWDIAAAAELAVLDRDALRRSEERLNVGALWDGLVCDRRLMLGPWCKEFQDYQPRFDHDEMLCLLQTALTAVERLFDTVVPDVTFGFVPVTFGEYLCYQVAQARGIPQLYLYPTKIENYLAWMASFFGRPAHIVDAYADYQRTRLVDDAVERARRYVQQVGIGFVRHEGMILVPAKRRVALTPTRPLRALRCLVGEETRYWRSVSRDDNHVQSPTGTLLQRRLLGPRRARSVTRSLARRYVSETELETLDFAFYPLHAEPEVALAIHGKPYINQIETARTVARSLPVGMHLVVKEHPRCLGYRPVSYYDKLLRIPNLRLADPNTESKGLIQGARLVTTVWSFVRFESVLHHTPVIVLGTPLYGILPRSMIRHVTDLNRLHAEIVDLLRTFEHDAVAVAYFVAACMRGGVPMDLYARFIEKTGRHVDDDGTTDEEQFERFVGYTVDRVRAVAGRGAVNEADVRTSVAE